MEKLIKRNDLLLIITVLVVAGGLFLLIRLRPVNDRVMVQVSIDSRVWGEYSLNEPLVLELPCGNTLSIHDGRAEIINADCPDKLCVRMPEITKEGQSIICLPHKLILEVVAK